ncbi:hypothetical protein QYM36_000103 [Artemia franciscana]|uniref:PiggyBac transposable element-derived protein domain-containing protein n=1 Tax=Artemia franciscana TaxID=6661 RepID=A0AA88IBL0_ARTSF|nr:hypothetical protein QYM36_000103 [Artemia franciscana]
MTLFIMNPFTPNEEVAEALQENVDYDLFTEVNVSVDCGCSSSAITSSLAAENQDRLENPNNAKPAQETTEPDLNKILTPVEYFKKTFDDDTAEGLVFQSDLYVTSKDQLKVTSKEMVQILGIHMLMGILKQPKISQHWERAKIFPLIADFMYRNRLKTLRRFFHANDSHPADKSYSWGINIFSRAGATGIIDSFEVYTGKGLVPVNELGQGAELCSD